VTSTNYLKTGLLLAVLTGLLVLVGATFGGEVGLVIALALALVMNGAAYWFSDRMALRMAHARPIEPGEVPWLHGMVHELAGRAAIPVPRLFLIDDSSTNAFATGRNPGHGVVAVTTGSLELLPRNELAGVIAHELAHIKNRDILLSSVAATIAGTLTTLASILQWNVLFGGDDEDEGGSMAGVLLMIVVAPIAATLLQLAISRSREFAADALGARISGDPLALADALRRLEQGVWLRPMRVNPAAAPLYIVHPFAGGGVTRLFQTHPPIVQRIERLRALAANRLGSAAAM